MQDYVKLYIGAIRHMPYSRKAPLMPQGMPRCRKNEIGSTFDPMKGIKLTLLSRILLFSLAFFALSSGLSSCASGKKMRKKKCDCPTWGQVEHPQDAHAYAID